MTDIKTIEAELALFDYIRNCASDKGWEECRDIAYNSKNSFGGTFLKYHCFLLICEEMIVFRVNNTTFKWSQSLGSKDGKIHSISLCDPGSLKRIKEIF